MAPMAASYCTGGLAPLLLSLPPLSLLPLYYLDALLTVTS